MKAKKIYIYDTTLRDGNQATGISFTLDDKMLIAQKIDSAGVDYIEGGWPNPTNTTDAEFFKKINNFKIKAKITAFGSTRRAHQTTAEDEILNFLLKMKTPAITIFGKSWDLHVTNVIKTTLKENLLMIEDSVKYLKKRTPEIIYDAEHFFDGYKANKDYALKTLIAAENGGADCIVLCDTNGGTLPDEYLLILEEVKKIIKTPLGIHNHNDAGMAEANSIIGITHGCVHVQGTFNGIGERCGNANLSTIIPNLKLKLGYNVCTDAQIKQIKNISHYIYELANVEPRDNQPFVGDHAFSHKGGAHIDGVIKAKSSFEHIDPELVGNERRYVLSDQAGGSAIVEKLQSDFPNITKKDPIVKKVLNKIKELEHQGYTFEAAEGSFQLLVHKEMGLYKEPFSVKGFRVIEEKLPNGDVYSEATIKIEADNKEYHTAAEGNGPVNAMDKALRKALNKFFPQLAEVQLIDFKVRVLSGVEGTGSKVHVLIESTDQKEF